MPLDITLDDDVADLLGMSAKERSCDISKLANELLRGALIPRSSTNNSGGLYPDSAIPEGDFKQKLLDEILPEPDVRRDSVHL